MTDSMEKDIKDYRDKELRIFVFGNILLILLGTGFVQSITQLLGEDNVWKAVAGLFDSSILSAVLYIYIFILDSIIPGEFKDKIIWPIRRLPGNWIFMDIKNNNKDERFTTEMALKMYSDLYQQIEVEKDKKKRAKIQNEFWYKLYQKYESRAQVFVSQRDFLLCRDMAVLMVWVFVGAVALSLYRGGISCKLWSVLVVEFFVIWIAARVKGERFAYNVIAKDLASFKE